MPASTRKWPSQCRGWSTCPYIIVELDRMASSWAVVTTSIQGAVGTLAEEGGVRVGFRVRWGEGADRAADVADVGEVDVAVAHVRAVLADRVPPQVVGDPGQLVQGGPVALQQGDGGALVSRQQQARRVAGGQP